jgi:hypothetical protein
MTSDVWTAEPRDSFSRSPIPESLSEAAANRLVDQTAVARRSSAEALGIGTCPDTAEIETIRIPAGLGGDVRFDEAIAVVSARVHEQSRLLVRERDEPLLAQALDPVRGARAVPGIASVVLATRVVEEREPRHDSPARAGPLREDPPVPPDASPVRRTVDPRPVEPKARAQQQPQRARRSIVEPEAHAVPLTHPDCPAPISFSRMSWDRMTGCRTAPSSTGNRR